MTQASRIHFFKSSQEFYFTSFILCRSRKIVTDKLIFLVRSNDSTCDFLHIYWFIPFWWPRFNVFKHSCWLDIFEQSFCTVLKLVKWVLFIRCWNEYDSKMFWMKFTIDMKQIFFRYTWNAHRCPCFFGH